LGEGRVRASYTPASVRGGGAVQYSASSNLNRVWGTLSRVDPFFKMDVFFFAATLALVLCTVFISIAFFYVLRILRNLDAITEEAKEETRRLRNDLAEARMSAKAEGKRLLALMQAFRRTVKRLLGKWGS
jgi:hypothetical protein